MPKKGHKWTEEQRRQRSIAFKGRKLTHGMTHQRFYWVYQAMIARCNNPKHPAYHWYGGRGIKSEWKNFEEFMADMLPTYLQHKEQNITTSLDRTDNNGNYSKENCRWITRRQQMYNTRLNRVVSLDGKEMSLYEACQILNKPYKVMVNRINTQGMTFEQSIIKPIKLKRLVGKPWRIKDRIAALERKQK